QLAGHAPSRDRGVRDRGQALSRDIVDDVEDTKAPSTGELVMHEVDRPAGIGLGCDENRGPRSHGAPARTAFAHGEAFLTIEPIDAIDASPFSGLPQKPKHPPIAEALA